MELEQSSLNDITELTIMNIQLREDERVDNKMSEKEIENRMKGFLSSKDYEVLLLKEESEILGYCLVDKSKTPIYLRQLFVVREKRGNGIGKVFINKILAYFEKKELDIEVMIWNESTIRFYEKTGFEKRYIGMRLKK